MTSNMKKSQYMKLVVIGNIGVGKSSLLKSLTHRSIHNENDLIPTTVGLDIITCKQDSTKLKIYDYSGEIRIKNQVYSQCKDADAVLFVYDVTNRESFEFRRDIATINQSVCDHHSDVSLFLIGNKIDKEKSRQISKEEGQLMADSFAMCGFWETSAIIGQEEDVLRSITLFLREKLEYKIVEEQVRLQLRQNAMNNRILITAIVFECKRAIKRRIKTFRKRVAEKVVLVRKKLSK